MKTLLGEFLKASMLLLFIITGCGEGDTQTLQPPVQSTTQVATDISSMVLTSSPSPFPERKDVPIYKNLFEGNPDQVLGGLSSENNQMRVNTEIVDYQSGLQSLEIYGTLLSATYSSLNVTLWMEPLIGETTIDLSHKTVGFIFYVPEDSSIDFIGLVAMSPLGQVTLFGTSLISGEIRRGEWQSIQVDLQPIYENGTWSWSDLSPEDSRSVIKYANSVMIVGIRSSEGLAAETSFLIDSFKWLENEISWRPPLDPDAATLRNYADARNLKISSVIWNTAYYSNFIEPWYRYTLANQMNMTTVYSGVPPEEKPTDISAMEFDYSPGDEVLAFAEENEMLLEGGTGGWHTNNPRWITDGTYDELKAYLDRKIESDISYYAGKVLYWGVFNEVLDSDGTSFHNRQAKDPYDVLYGTIWAPYGGRYSPYVDGNDTSLIEFAFSKAESVDPIAKYYLNDYGIEEIGTPRAEFFFNFVKGMKDRGIPIDGVGMQLHLIYPNSPAPGSTNLLADVPGYLDRIDQNVKRYSAADLFVAFTEFECQIRLDDLDLTTQAGWDEYTRRQQVQAEIYAGMMKIVRDNPNIAFFRFWTLSDQPMTSAFDWSGMETAQNLHGFRFTDSFLFDRNYEPKAAFFSALEVLKP